MTSNDYITEETELLTNLSTTYTECKRLFIRAEEILEPMKFFVAPLIEHRDALDHLMRYIPIKGTSEALKELNSALGHEIRAYFDVADFVCITVRDEISTSLKKIKPKDIKKIWGDYCSVKEKIVSFSEEIARIRQNRKGSLEDIEKYKDALEEVFSIYELYKTKIEPNIRAKKFVS